jgi:hypothetical protein
LGGFGDLGPAGRRWEGHDGNYVYKGIDRERKGIFEARNLFIYYYIYS